MGGMGGSMRPPGKSGLTFDHILSRLQGELQKSRETGAELHSLTTAMEDIHDTLGGALVRRLSCLLEALIDDFIIQPANLPSYPSTLPPVRPPQQQHTLPPDTHASPSSSEPVPLSTLGELQTQLHETQSMLASHIDKIRALEGALAEHEAMKREIGALREMMEERKRELEVELRRDASRHHEDEQESEDIDDDARSIHTIIPHELERVVEEDEEQLRAEEEEDRRRRREELGRPRTPEPTGLGLTEDDYDVHHRDHDHGHNVHRSEQRSPSPPSHHPQESAIIDELSRRLAVLSERIESVLESDSHLQAEHAVARSTISDLVGKVSALEALVQATQGQVQAQQLTLNEVVQQQTSPGRMEERESLTTMLNEWKKSVEGQWSAVREEWSQERERLSRAREEWEARVRAVENGLGSAVGRVDAGVATLAAIQTQVLQQQQRQQKTVSNGDARHGLVTPPSPRSLSSDSNSSRSRQRKRRSSSSRGRSRSLPHTHTNDKSTRNGDGELELLGMALGDEEDDATCVVGQDSESIVPGGFTGTIKSRPFSPPLRLLDALKMKEQSTKMSLSMSAEEAARTLATPDPSVRMSASQSTVDSKSDQSVSEEVVCDLGCARCTLADDLRQPGLSVSTAVGVLVLSVAAAAVLWRVKPE